jgi:subtilase family serine protease
MHRLCRQAAVTLVLVLTLAAGAAAAPLKPGFDGISDTPSSTQPHWACPRGVCDAIADPHPAAGAALQAVYEGRKPTGSGKLGGLAPKDLLAAYAIPTTGGVGQTVAVVEGFVYKQAESDLAQYRARYGLPACTVKNGCLQIVNGKGQAPKFQSGTGWELEVALDLDMVSAACQECHIILVDSEEESWDALGKGASRAASMGATEISNSYGLPEETCEGSSECANDAADWDHPGIFVTVSAGDDGWNNFAEGADSPSYPADLPFVAAIGGTSLKKAKSKRGFSETVWGEGFFGGTGSGCSLQPKPAWQHDACAGRTENDVSAVGACNTPVSVYSTPEGGWELVCGTSASSPIVAATEAHATAFSRTLPGGEAFYEPGVSLFDVKSGNNGHCPKAQVYLCHGEKGYDGPTGNGTPDGPLALER